MAGRRGCRLRTSRWSWCRASASTTSSGCRGWARSGSSNPGAGPETSSGARAGGARPRRGAELAARRLPERPAARCSAVGEPGERRGAGDLRRAPRRRPAAERPPLSDPRRRRRATRGCSRRSRPAIPGLVSIVDVAPTALGTGGRARLRARGRTPLPTLLDLDERIDENNGVRLPATLLACALVLVLALVCPRRRSRASRPRSLANLALGIAGVSDFWAVLLVIGLAAALGGPLLARDPPLDRSRLGWASAAVHRRVPARARDRRRDGRALPVRADPELPLLRPLEPPRRRCCWCPPWRAPRSSTARSGWAAFGGRRPARVRHRGRKPLRRGRRRRDRAGGRLRRAGRAARGRAAGGARARRSAPRSRSRSV